MKSRNLVQWMVGLVGLMMGCAVAAPFLPPAEGPVPFRRDKIALDTDDIGWLSKAMMTMAQGVRAKTPGERRAVAQMLAVAQALDPADSHVKKLLEELPEKDFHVSVDDENVTRTHKRVWQTIEWLEMPDAGIDGQALAACLKDVMVVADPKNLRSDALRGTGEQAAWSGWVPVLASYEERLEPQNTEVEDKKETTTEEPKEPKERQPDGPPKIRLAEASLPALIWKNVAKEWPPRWQLMPLSMTMRAEIRPRAEWEIEQGIHRKTISIGSHSESHSLSSMESKVENLLRNKFGSLPQDMVLEIRHPELDQSIDSGNRHALSGVCGVLAYAAISGVEPAGLIVGQLDENGKFTTTTDFWGQFVPLLEMTGLRLIVPAEGEEILMALLALEKPDFFLNNEVLLAKDIDEIMSLAAKKPQPPLDGVFGRFDEIQEKRGGQDVRIYIGNSFIRQRLDSIQQEESRHLSAKALVIQALGKRPTTVTRQVLASELLKVVRTLGWVRTTEYIEPKTSKPLATAYQDCRTQIDRLTKYARKEDQQLVDKATEAALAVRDVDRAAKGRGEYWEIEEEIRSKKRSMNSAYDNFDKFIDDILKK